MAEQYIVSARKYRPDSFSELIGQDNIVQTLKNSIIRGQLAHAYLFCGPRGVGKTSAARIFAKTINCEHPTPEMEPCGHCESCVSFQEGRSYCIHELDAASNNSVDDIKQLIDQVNIPPQIGRYSVYIVDEVHMLSQAAFNAFLKTLEEPPAHAIFILATTEKHKILPTILSRCQTYDFNRISIPDIVRNLRAIATKEDVHVDDESLHIIAQKADGAMRDALTIFDQTVAFCGNDIKYDAVIKNLNVLDYEHCFRLVDDFLRADYGAALLKFDEILSKGFNALHFVAALSKHFRDLIVAKTGGLDALLELPDSLKKKYKEQADRCSLQFLYDALAANVACEQGYRGAVNQRLHIEFTLMRLSFLSGGPVSLKPAAARAQRLPAAERPAVSAASAAQPMPQAAPKAVSQPIPQTSSPSAPVSTTEAESVPATEPEPAPAQSAQAEPVRSVEAPVSAAPASETAEAPARRRHISKAASALSMLTKSKEETKEQAPKTEGGVPDDDKILEAWNSLPDNYKNRPRLAVALQNAKTSIDEAEGGKILTFEVTNVNQKTWIEGKLLFQLEGEIQKILGTDKLRLRVDVPPENDEEPKKIYKPREQAEDLMSKNEEVRKLVNDLGLDTK